jgi:hypothetical protein
MMHVSAVCYLMLRQPILLCIEDRLVQHSSSDATLGSYHDCLEAAATLTTVLYQHRSHVVFMVFSWIQKAHLEQPAVMGGSHDVYWGGGQAP